MSESDQVLEHLTAEEREWWRVANGPMFPGEMLCRSLQTVNKLRGALKEISNLNEPLRLPSEQIARKALENFEQPEEETWIEETWIHDQD